MAPDTAWLTVPLTLFAMINPIANVPFFVSLTDGYARKEWLGALRRAMVAAAAVLVVFAVLGELLFYLYGVTLPAFRVAGGIIVGKLGFDMVTGRPLQTKRTPRETVDALEQDDIGIVPLGIPLHAGPGAMTAAVLIAADARSATDWGVLLSSIIVVLAISFVVLYNARRIFERVGRSGTLVMSRVLGLVTLAVGVRLIQVGITAMIGEAA